MPRQKAYSLFVFMGTLTIGGFRFSPSFSGPFPESIYHFFALNELIFDYLLSFDWRVKYHGNQPEIEGNRGPKRGARTR